MAQVDKDGRVTVDEIVADSLTAVYMESFVTVGTGTTGPAKLTEGTVTALQAMSNIEALTKDWDKRGYSELTRIFNTKLNARMKRLGITRNDRAPSLT